MTIDEHSEMKSGPETGADDNPVQLCHDGHYERAIALLQERLKAEETDQNLRLLGRCLVMAEQDEEAVDSYAKLHSKTPDDFYFLGIALVGLERWAEAVDSFLNSLIREERGYSYYWLAVAYCENKEFRTLGDSAKKSVVEALRNSIAAKWCPVDSFLWLDSALTSAVKSYEGLRKEVVPDKIEILKEGLKRFPENEEICFQLATLLSRWKNDEGVLQIISPFLGMKEVSPRLLWRAYKAAFTAADADQALSLLLKITQTKCTYDSSLWMLIGDLYLQIGQHEEAADSHLKAFQGSRDDTVRIRSAMELSKIKAAQSDFESALYYAGEFANIWFDSDPDGEHYHIIRIDNEYLDEYDESEVMTANCKVILDIITGKSESALLIGRLMYILSVLSNDHVLLRKASGYISHPLLDRDLRSLAIDEGNFESATIYHLNYARWKWKESQSRGIHWLPEDAKMSCDTAEIKTKSARRNIHKLALEILKECADKDEAAEVFIPFYRSFWRPLLLDKQLYKEMQETLRILLSHSPSSNLELFDSAYSLHELSDLSEAEKQYRKLLSAEPEHSSALHNLSIIVHGHGNIREALELSQRAVAILPEHALFTNWNAKLAAENGKMERIVSISSIESLTIVNPRSLSFSDAVYLLSLIRVAGDEGFERIESRLEWPALLSPTRTYDLAILRQLYNNGLIGPSPSSRADLFTVEGDLISFDLERIAWVARVGSSPSDVQKVIQDLECMFRIREWPESWRNEYLSLWKELALAECIAYLEVVMQDHGFLFDPGDKTMLVLSEMLETFSVSQGFSFIWSAVASSAAYYAREKANISRKQAANSTVGTIQRRVERARIEGWEVKEYRRDRRLPESSISMVLFNTALQIGDKGFFEAPNITVDLNL